MADGVVDVEVTDPFLIEATAREDSVFAHERSKMGPRGFTRIVIYTHHTAIEGSGPDVIEK
jgi:hypothetical protein